MSNFLSSLFLYNKIRILKINLDRWDLDIIPSLFLCVLIPLLICFTLWLIITGIIGVLRMLDSKKWVLATGKLISTEIKYKDFSSNDYTTRKYVEIKSYFYEVNGQYFLSNQTLASDSLFTKEFKSLHKNWEQENYKNILNLLNSGKDIRSIEGEEIAVFFNPKKPQIACLENRFDNQIFVQIIMGLILGIGVLSLMYFLTRNMIE